MGIFRRRYKDGRLSTDWYINYRIHGKQYKRKIGPNKKLAEQVLHDIELKQAKGDPWASTRPRRFSSPRP